MKIIGSRDGEHRGWPGYLFGGRMRTSTLALILAFLLTWWVFDTYQPEPAAAPAAPAVVPPGFVPDPDYTWVPRTSVRTAPPETTRRTYTTTTTTTTTPTTTETTTPTSTEPGPPTTVVDPDGDGPLVATTLVDPDGPGPLPATTVPPTSTVPDRSGVQTITPPTPAPGLATTGPSTTPTTPPPKP